MYEEYYGDNDYRDYLEHHGIKNQKWGVQNGPPYPLNAEGKASFRDKLEERRKQKKKLVRLKKARKARAAKIKAQKREEEQVAKSKVRLGRTNLKDLKKMSDKEVRERIARLKLEEELRKLEKGEKSRVQQMVEDALLDAGKQLITKTVVDAASKTIKEAFDMDEKEKSESARNAASAKLSMETARAKKEEAKTTRTERHQKQIDYYRDLFEKKDKESKGTSDKSSSEEKKSSDNKTKSGGGIKGQSGGVKNDSDGSRLERVSGEVVDDRDESPRYNYAGSYTVVRDQPSYLLEDKKKKRYY